MSPRSHDRHDDRHDADHEGGLRAARAQSAGDRPGLGVQALRLQWRAAPTRTAHAAVACKRSPAHSCMVMSETPLPTLALGRSAKRAPCTELSSSAGRRSMEWVHWTVRRGAEAARWVWVCSGTSAKVRWRRWRTYTVVAGRSAERAVGAPIMVTGMRTPCRAYQHGGELSLAGMHRVGSCPTGGCMETSWRATLLGRGPGGRGGALSSAGSQGGGWDGDAPPLPAGSRCATLLDRTDRMARQGVTASASDGNEGGHVGSGTDTHTHSHTHTHGVLGRLLDRVAEGWARVRSAFGDG